MTIQNYNDSLDIADKDICDVLANEIATQLSHAEGKIWHAHPVWFIDGNPIVGYSKQKAGVRLMFWSGADFGESRLIPTKGKFKDASIFYNAIEDVNRIDLIRWLALSVEIQWDYKNIVKRKGDLQKLKNGDKSTSV